MFYRIQNNIQEHKKCFDQNSAINDRKLINSLGSRFFYHNPLIQNNICISNDYFLEYINSSYLILHKLHFLELPVNLQSFLAEDEHQEIN